MWTRSISLTALHGLALAYIGGSSGCLAEPPKEAATSDDVTCSDFGCNDNSPMVSSTPAYELHRAGQQNSKGVRITGFRSAGGVPYQIDVRQARLVGLDPSGNVALDTPDMVGAVISVVDIPGNTWEITVLEVGSIPFWAPPEGDAVTYHLGLHGGPGGQISGDLCPRPPPGDNWPVGTVPHAMVFEGDRYQLLQKTVSASGSATAGWFNIACAGTAIAKLHLMRHTEAGANPALPTTRTQRQAMLRALTATICPGSTSFTALGEKLYVADRSGVMPGPINLDSIEALWDENGAICLGEQRLVHANSMRQLDADQMLTQIAVQCPAVPSCDTLPGLRTSWAQAGYVLSTNPP